MRQVTTAAADIEVIKERARDGVVALVLREVAVRVLALAGGVILARLLAPSVFGIFAIATFATGAFSLLSELGLGAALIRRPGSIATTELSALFTFQLVSTTILALGLFAAAPPVCRLFHALQAVWVIRALCAALVLSSFRTVPLVLAERKLNYRTVTVADVSAQVTYWCLAVAGVVVGFAVWSLVVALLVSSAVGIIALSRQTEWRPTLNFDWTPIRSNLGFGLLYQGQSATHFAKDTMVVSLGGLAYGPAAVGYLSWALQLAGTPLQLTQLVARVAYPALAKLQDDRAAFAAMLESTLTWTCRFSLPIFAVLIGLAPQIIAHVYGPRWTPALPALYWLSVNMILSIATGILMPALYSAGRARIGLSISAGWTAVTVLVALAMIASGFSFVALAVAHSVGTALALTAIIYAVRGVLNTNLLARLARPLSTAIAIVVALTVVRRIVPGDLWSLAMVATFALAVGLVANLWGDGRAVRATIRSALAVRA